MLVSKNTVALIFNVITFTGEIGTDGKPVQRMAFPARSIRAYNSLRKKIVETLCEVGVVPSDKPVAELVEADIQWLPNSMDFKAPEGTIVRTDRFIDGVLELTDSEKALVKSCITDEIPVASDKELDELNALTGLSL